jgi:hypothetical protein
VKVWTDHRLCGPFGALATLAQPGSGCNVALDAGSRFRQASNNVFQKKSSIILITLSLCSTVPGELPCPMRQSDPLHGTKVADHHI